MLFFPPLFSFPLSCLPASSSPFSYPPPPSTPSPNCRSFGSSHGDAPMCKEKGCDGQLRLVRHVSFVDCPGHDILMATMLNGAAVMDAALLLVGSLSSPPLLLPLFLSLCVCVCVVCVCVCVCVWCVCGVCVCVDVTMCICTVVASPIANSTNPSFFHSLVFFCCLY